MNRAETRKLMCQLTEHEVMQRGEEMAKTYIQVAALDMEKKRITAKIKPLDERIEELVTIIDSKEEERDVECRWVPDWNAGTKSLIRNDTGEEVEWKKLQEWERQQQWDFNQGKQQDVCPKCDGDGQYIEDGIEDGGREVYCDCPAGIALKEKETGDARQQETAGPEATEEKLEADCADAGAAGEQVKPLCAICIGLCGDYTPGTQVSECPNHTCDAASDIADPCAVCRSGRAGCYDCCSACTNSCNAAQFCHRDYHESICSICVSPSCGENSPGHSKEDCTGFRAEFDADQVARRDKTCSENWRECEFAAGCFGPANEEGDDAACDCLKEVASKDQQLEQARAQRLAHLQAKNPKAAPSADLCFNDLMKWGYTGNEAKIIAAGFHLVKYDRPNKIILALKSDPRAGFASSLPYPTFSAAERELENMLKAENTICISMDGRYMVDHGEKRLRDKGFEFYRSEGIIPGHGTPRIKIGSKNWGTWKKFDTPEECEVAWEELLSTDPKALEG